MMKSADSSNQCHLCGGKRFEDIHTDEIFRVGDKHVLVEHIPASRCRNCGELTFSKETVERVRLLLHESAQPARTVTLDVFDLAIV